MGVTKEELSAAYPYLYHMAAVNSWEGIRKHGLLSTSSLLTLFEVQGKSRERIELQRRNESVEISHPKHGSAVIRDQKPIIESKLKAALTDCKIEDWYLLLNGRVFFWLNRDRLATLLSAKEYRLKPHLVLTLETLPLVSEHEDKITLSPMNSGNTLPIAHKRGKSTFMTIKDYPFGDRLKYGPYYTVVELAVTDGVPNILKYANRAEKMQSDGENLTSLETIYAK
jgi:hypothetical protein